DVFYTANKLSKLEGVCYEERLILGTAALLHDIVFEIGAKDNEEKSAYYARKHLPKLGYSVYQNQRVYDIILATKIPTHPKSKLEKIICDADVVNLGREDFFERGEEVRQELGTQNGKAWYKVQLDFLNNHKYYTQSAKKLLDYGVKQNIKKVKEKLRRYERGG
ncbi:hypothetical protein KY341_03650, partial [Candidatus Woesearchaeota archaeon]|nr:hypothetical protein [Candidatus Woesearchaeota archaeon]